MCSALLPCSLCTQAAKAEALDYVEVEVRELKQGFEAKEREQAKSVEQLRQELQRAQAELTALTAATELNEAERREEAAKCAAAEGRVRQVEAEMRALLAEVARRQQLASQVAQLAQSLRMP